MKEKSKADSSPASKLQENVKDYKMSCGLSTLLS